MQFRSQGAGSSDSDTMAQTLVQNVDILLPRLHHSLLVLKRTELGIEN